MEVGGVWGGGGGEYWGKKKEHEKHTCSGDTWKVSREQRRASICFWLFSHCGETFEKKGKKEHEKHTCSGDTSSISSVSRELRKTSISFWSFFTFAKRSEQSWYFASTFS